MLDTLDKLERDCAVLRDAKALWGDYGGNAWQVARTRAAGEPEWDQALRWWKVAQALAEWQGVSLDAHLAALDNEPSTTAPASVCRGDFNRRLALVR